MPYCTIVDNKPSSVISLDLQFQGFTSGLSKSKTHIPKGAKYCYGNVSYLSEMLKIF